MKYRCYMHLATEINRLFCKDRILKILQREYAAEYESKNRIKVT